MLQSKQDSASRLLATGNPEGLLVSAQPGSTPRATCQSWVHAVARLRIFQGSPAGACGEVRLIWADWEFLSPATTPGQKHLLKQRQAGGTAG